MKTKILISLFFVSLSVLSQESVTNWQSEGDSIEYISSSSVKVGIRTNNPLEALHVNGYLRGNGSVGELTIRTDCGTTTIGAVSWGYSHFRTSLPRFYFYQPIMIKGGELSSANGDNLYFKTFEYKDSGSVPRTRMTILNKNGYVGIGKTSPQYKLDVAGNIHALDSILSSIVVAPEIVTSNIITNKLVVEGMVENVAISRAIMDTIASVYTLTVESDVVDIQGGLMVEELLVRDISGADFVFDNDYKLRPLNEVEDFIETYKHLPEIQSAKDMKENGLNINDFQIKLLQKIEELTLYIINQENRIKELEQQLNK